jgi:hypothetical protein
MRESPSVLIGYNETSVVFDEPLSRTSAGGTAPPIALMNVLLPHPVSPTQMKVLPGMAIAEVKSLWLFQSGEVDCRGIEYSGKPFLTDANDC